MTTRPRPAPSAGSASPSGPIAVPCLMIRRGKVAVPGETGPVVARTAGGAPLDIFEVVDRLSPRFHRLYVVDLDAVESGDPQLDYLQEIARDAEIWLDAGVRNANDAIDALVTGASRAVITSSLARSPRTVAKAWELSQDIVFDLEMRDGSVDARSSEWRARPPEEIAAQVRASGVPDIIVSNREGPIDWPLVQRLSRTGPTWVDGTFERAQTPELGRWGSAGGIFHLTNDLLTAGSTAPTPPLDSSRARRDDENENQPISDE